MPPSKKIGVKHIKLGRQQAWGQADLDKMIAELDPRLMGRKKFAVAIEECLHVLNPEWSETKTKHQARRITQFCWDKLKYRQVDDRKRQRE